MLFCECEPYDGAKLEKRNCATSAVYSESDEWPTRNEPRKVLYFLLDKIHYAHLREV